MSILVGKCIRLSRSNTSDTDSCLYVVRPGIGLVAAVVAGLRRDVARHQLQGLVLISAFPSAMPPQTSLALLFHILAVQNLLLCHSLFMMG